MRQDEKRQARVVILLITIIILLLLVLAYTFLLAPAINGYIIKKQGDAVEQVLTLMILQVQQQGFTQIVDNRNNRSVILIPYVPQEQQGVQTLEQSLQ